jgi:formamidase
VPETLIGVDLRLPPEEQYPRPHNRWHPEIPPAASVDPGAVFRLECLDLSGGQVVNSDSADDVRDLDLAQLHYLTGPVAVNGAQPGDLLVVDILDIGPLRGAEWGYTGILDRQTGTGLLTDEYPAARKAIWDLNGVFATSRHVQDVRFTALPHPGTIGCAPSPERMARWNRRELKVASTHGGLFAMGTMVPQAQGALMGGLSAAAAERTAGEAPRTWAARENGGNLDVKELARGSRAYLPVYLPGANLSVGDLQFSQGDGKITGLGGVKMAGYIDLHVDLIPDGINRTGITSPVFEPAPVDRGYSEYLTFQGISVDENDTQHYLDVWVAYRMACRHAIRHLQRYGFTGEQAYVLLAAAPVNGHISCMLEHPNVCCTVAIPSGIFEFEIGPRSEIRSAPRGELARPS